MLDERRFRRSEAHLVERRLCVPRPGLAILDVYYCHSGSRRPRSQERALRAQPQDAVVAGAGFGAAVGVLDADLVQSRLSTPRGVSIVRRVSRAEHAEDSQESSRAPVDQASVSSRLLARDRSRLVVAADRPRSGADPRQLLHAHHTEVIEPRANEVPRAVRSTVLGEVRHPDLLVVVSRSFPKTPLA